MAKKIGDITIKMVPNEMVQISQPYGCLDDDRIFICQKELKEVAAELTRLAEKKIE